LLVTRKRQLLFISPRFLYPVDSGGKIRTTQILRGLKGGELSVVLISPATADDVSKYSTEIDGIADRFEFWDQPPRSLKHRILSYRHLLSGLPIPVASDWSDAGKTLVRKELSQRPDVVVFDFAHAAVLAPDVIDVPSLLFTHNVEAEIFQRHAAVASNPFKKKIWLNQFRKMRQFERSATRRFDSVIAVSNRDLEAFESAYGISGGKVIDTGVDLEFFAYTPPARANTIVFTASMDWLANIDAVEYMMESIWPLLLKEAPDLSFDIVGRSPPGGLQQKVRSMGLNWRFTGFVDDIRPYVHDAAVYVIPLRVGGGTRLKVYEAMAMGAPVVSTSIGTEGLSATPGKHYLRADDPDEFAAAILQLLRDDERREAISRSAREFVETHCSHRVIARQFERICMSTIDERSSISD
jgi:glycosyltransferase involved in cell wall biosynthesis